MLTHCTQHHYLLTLHTCRQTHTSCLGLSARILFEVRGNQCIFFFSVWLRLVYSQTSTDISCFCWLKNIKNKISKVICTREDVGPLRMQLGVCTAHVLPCKHFQKKREEGLFVLLFWHLSSGIVWTGIAEGSCLVLFGILGYVSGSRLIWGHATFVCLCAESFFRPISLCFVLRRSHLMPRSLEQCFLTVIKVSSLMVNSPEQVSKACGCLPFATWTKASNNHVEVLCQHPLQGICSAF